MSPAHDQNRRQRKGIELTETMRSEQNKGDREPRWRKVREGLYVKQDSESTEG